MTAITTTPHEPLAGEPPDFSLVLGGPLYQLWRRAHLTGDALQALHRRILVMTSLAWVPLLALSVAEGYAWGGNVKLPFLYDVELHVRFLIALPVLILAELVVHRRMRPVVWQFLTRGLVPDAARPQFDAAVASALRLRNSITAEVLLIVGVYGLVVFVVPRTQIALDEASWYGVSVDGKLQPSLAGWWLRYVSLPLFQFVLLRWYFRLFIWARLLWQVSRIDLNLMPMHPDRCGGLGFLSGIIIAFTPVLVAQGVMLAGLMANRIFYAGATLPQFKVELIGLVAVLVFTILGPLLVFSQQLSAARRSGSRDYGILAGRYAREFHQKWICGGAPPDEPLMGSADIQSLADMGNSFEVVNGMRLAPFTLQTGVQLAVATLLPVLPLTLTMIPLEELLDRLLQIVI